MRTGLSNLKDCKNRFTYTVFSLLNKLVLSCQFAELIVTGQENLPQTGPYLLVSNHVSRFDGLIIYKIINRPANFMVSPNELLGLQGAVLTAMGSFPANPRFDLLKFIQEQTTKGEAVVIFPEGDIYRDGSTHTFKRGTAKLALACMHAGINLPIIPTAINYNNFNDGEKPKVAQILIGSPIDLKVYGKQYCHEPNVAISSLTTRLHREVCHLRFALGASSDSTTLFMGKATKSWVH